MAEIKFDTTATDGRLITALAKRANRLAAKLEVEYSVMDASMDLTACHANGCVLDLARMVGADDANFWHDVFGIRRHLDRSTGRLGGCFLPRFALKEAEAA